MSRRAAHPRPRQYSPVPSLAPTIGPQLGDFGISKILASSQAKAMTQCGTPLYMSPEMCDGRQYTSAADVWALGCVLYELMSLHPPWVQQMRQAGGDRGWQGLMLRITTEALDVDALKARYSDGLCAVLSALLTKDAARRPALSTLLQSPVLSAAEDAATCLWPDSPSPKHAEPLQANDCGREKPDNARRAAPPPGQNSRRQRRQFHVAPAATPSIEPPNAPSDLTAPNGQPAHFALKLHRRATREARRRAGPDAPAAAVVDSPAAKTRCTVATLSPSAAPNLHQRFQQLALAAGPAAADQECNVAAAQLVQSWRKAMMRRRAAAASVATAAAVVPAAAPSPAACDAPPAAPAAAEGDQGEAEGEAARTLTRAVRRTLTRRHRKPKVAGANAAPILSVPVLSEASRDARSAAAAARQAAALASPSSSPSGLPVTPRRALQRTPRRLQSNVRRDAAAPAPDGAPSELEKAEGDRSPHNEESPSCKNPQEPAVRQSGMMCLNEPRRIRVPAPPSTKTITMVRVVPGPDQARSPRRAVPVPYGLCVVQEQASQHAPPPSPFRCKPRVVM